MINKNITNRQQWNLLTKRALNCCHIRAFPFTFGDPEFCAPSAPRNKLSSAGSTSSSKIKGSSSSLSK